VDDSFALDAVALDAVALDAVALAGRLEGGEGVGAAAGEAAIKSGFCSTGSDLSVSLSGIRNLAEQAGQTPRRPASSLLMFKRLPHW
jgi:hypothetical protein